MGNETEKDEAFDLLQELTQMARDDQEEGAYHPHTVVNEKSNGHPFPVELKDPITQREYENWTQHYQDLGGEDAKGIAIITGITVRAIVKAGILETPAWASDEDIDNATPAQVMAVYRAFNAWHEATIDIPKN